MIKFDYTGKKLQNLINIFKIANKINLIMIDNLNFFILQKVHIVFILLKIICIKFKILF